MTALRAGRELASSEYRRRPNAPPKKRKCLRVVGEPTRKRASGTPADGTHRVPDPQPAHTPLSDPDRDSVRETWWESLARAEIADQYVRAMQPDAKMQSWPPLGAPSVVGLLHAPHGTHGPAAGPQRRRSMMRQKRTVGP